MDPKSDEGIFLGYATNSRAYRVHNSRTKTMMESINVVIDDLAGENRTNVVDGAIASDLQNDDPVVVKEPETNTEAPSSESNNAPKKGPSIRVQ
ncbi:gag-pol polyprotein, partial [Trifolium medium]|nr:gag-pol polyprotein [Trifolium medium]